MPQNVKRRGFFSLISPFLVFFGVSVVVQCIALFAIVFQNLPELMAGIDPTQLENIQNTQQLYISEAAVDMVVEQYMQHLVLLTSVTVLCTIPFFLWMFCRDKKYELQLGIPQVPKANAGRYIWIVLLGIVSNLAFNNILLLSNLAAFSEGYQEASQTLYAESLAMQLIGLGIITPIGEELMFRGLIYRRVRCMIGPKNAIIVSSLVFGMYHGNLVQGIYGFFLGLLMAWLYEKYGSILAPMLLHVCANMVSIVATKLQVFDWIFQSFPRIIVTTVACAACGAAVYVKIRNLFLEPEKDIEIKPE